MPGVWIVKGPFREGMVARDGRRYDTVIFPTMPGPSGPLACSTQ